MEKIGFPSSATFHLNPEKKGKRKEDKKKASKAGKTFSSIFEETDKSAGMESLSAGSVEGHEKLEEILDDLYQLGESLKSEQTISNLKKYRQSIQHFFKYVVNHGIEAEKIAGIRNPRTMEQKQYTLIKVVDGKLEKLAAHILSSQKSQIEILRGVDEIYGLLVDITS